MAHKDFLMAHGNKDIRSCLITRRDALGRLGVSGATGLLAASGLLNDNGNALAEDRSVAPLKTEAVSASFTSDGRYLVFTAPGFSSVRAAFSARLVRDGASVTISSADSANVVERHSPQQALVLGDRDKVSLSLTIREHHLQGFTLQAEIENHHTHAFRLYSLNAFETLDDGCCLKLAGSLGQWLGSQFLTSGDSIPLDQLTDRERWMSTCAGIYRADGVGLLIGSAGTGICATPTFLQSARNGSLRMRVESWMCGVQVDPGETRAGEETLFLFEPPASALESWAGGVGHSLKARTSTGPIAGWCSWYDKDIRITQEHVLAQVEILQKNADALRLRVIQVDDGYQKQDGDWSANERFPNGMAYVADRIKEAGFTAGIWISPLKVDPHLPWAREHPECLQSEESTGKPRFEKPNLYHPNGKLTIDPTHPTSQQFLREIIRNAVTAGYGYLKLDFNDIQQTNLFDRSKTQFQAMRDLYSLYRHEAGKDVYINCCMTNPEMAAVGYIDACRIGPDAWVGGLNDAMDPVMRAQPFNGKWFANDPDVTYLAETLQNRVAVQGGSRRLQTWHSIIGLTGGLAMTSDPLSDSDCSIHWSMLEMLLPPSPQNTRLLGLGLDNDRSCFAFTARGHDNVREDLSSRRRVPYSVVLAINRKTDESAVAVNLLDLGHGSDRRIAIWSFWDDRYLGTITGSHWLTKPMGTSESELLRFTDVTAAKNDILLIGSTLHITCGTEEIHEIRRRQNGIDVFLTDAGCRDGSLTLYSAQRIRVDHAAGCDVGDVQTVGEDVWRIPIRNRKAGSGQRLAIKITA